MPRTIVGTALKNCVHIESGCAVEIYSPNRDTRLPSVLSSRTRIGSGRPTLSTSPFFRARAESLLPYSSSPHHSHPLLLLRPPPLPHRQSLQNGKDARPGRAVHVQTNRNDRPRTPSCASSASRRCVGVMVNATERNADAHVISLSPLLLLHMIDLAGHW
jgi:hypothetical protein